jgi:hypothetical protein
VVELIVALDNEILLGRIKLLCILQRNLLLALTSDKSQ